ncbi:MAG: hypothetical protein ABIM36_04890 [candidate division WOR-3 bacterium]
MKFLFFILISKIIRDTILPEISFIILKTPVINSIKVYSKKNIEYQVKGDTLFLKGFYESDTVYVEYENIEIDAVYKKNEILLKEEEKILIKPVESKKEFEEIKLKGNKEVGFKIEEGNFSLVQSTNLKLDGKIGNNIEVEGVFQDENLPSEGTVSLSELEQAYFNIKSPYFKTKIGDFFLRGENIERKMLGMEAEGKTKGFFLKIGTGYGKGTFESIKIDVVPGKNGPYFLGIQRYERIVPGSEKVYLDNKLLKSGKDEDYIIDYERGIIVFNPKVNISNTSNLKIDFEKIEGGFDKYYFSECFSPNFKNFNLNFNYFLEKDFEKNPLFSLSDSDKIFLKTIGDTQKILYTKGYEYVGEGKGDYIKKGDTLIYVGEKNGNYVAQFIFVGENKGDYIFNDLKGCFEYVGKDKGDYIPRKILYLPQRKNFFSSSISFKQQKIEFFLSEFDKNIYSNLNDRDNVDFGIKTKNKFYYKENNYESGVNLSLKYFGKNLFFPFREKEANYEFLWKTKAEERKRVLLSPYFIYKDIFKLQNEIGYLSTDSGSVKRESYEFEFLKYFNTKETYEEIKGKERTYRNSFLISKKMNKYFVEFKNIFENSNFNSLSKEISFGHDNLFFTFSENSLFKNLYILSNSINTLLSFKSVFSIRGTFKYIFSKPYLKKINKDYFYNFFYNLFPYKDLRISINVIKNPEIVSEKNIEYIFVGEGKGNFSYDSLTKSFYPDENGSYIKREFFITKDDNGYKKGIYSKLEFSKDIYSIFLTQDREEKKLKEKILSRNENYSLNLNFDLPIYTSLYTIYSQDEDKEYYLYPFKRLSFEWNINFRKELKEFTPEAGFTYKFSEDKEQENVKARTREYKFLTGIRKGFEKINLRFSFNYGIQRNESPFYFGTKIMKKDYFELLPGINFFIFGTEIREEIFLIFQNVKNPFSNISFYEKEKWRVEEKVSLLKKIRENLETSLSFFLKIGEKTKTKSSFNFNFIAYF